MAKRISGRHKPRRYVGIPFDLAERVLHASAGLNLADTIKAACIEYAERRPKAAPARARKRRVDADT